MSKLNSVPPGGDKLNKVNSSPVKGGGVQSTPVITDGVKTDVSELLNPPSVDEPRLTIAEMKKIDDFVKSGKKLTDKCLREFPAKLRGEYLASKLIEAGKGSAVAIHLEKFHGVDHKVLASQLKTIMGWRIIVENIHNFTGLDHDLLFNELIKTGKGDMVARNLHKFKGLDLGLMISEFIKTERLDVIMEIIRIFTTDYGYRKGNNKGFRTQILANELVKAEKWELLADYLHHFRGLDHTILYKLIEIGKGDAVTRSLKNFLQIEQGEKVSSLIDKLLGGGCTDPLNLAKALHEQRLSWAIAQNIEKFPGVDHIYLAKKLREQLCYWIIAQNIEKFPLVQSLYSTDHDPRFLSSIDELDFTVRTSNSLKSEGIYTLGDLVQCTENELLKFPNLGRKCLHDIKVVLASRNLILGRKVEKWIQQYKS